MSELRPGWVWATLGDVCDRAVKWDPRSEPTVTFRYIDISSIDGQKIRRATSVIGADAPSRARQLVRAGDTVLSTVRTYLVNTAQVPDELDGSTASTGFCVLRPTGAIDSRFLFYRVIETGFVEALSRQQTGSSYPAVRDRDVFGQRVALPPLAEQRRIVAAVDENLSHLEAGVSQLQLAADRLQRLRSRIVDAAIAGPWELRSFGDLALTLRNGVFVSRPGAEPPGIPIFRISAVRPMALAVDDIRYAPASGAYSEEAFVDDGDLLFTRYSGNPAYVGACAMVPPLAQKTLHPDKLIRVTVDRQRCLPGYIEIAFAARSVRRNVEDRLKTTAGQVGIAGSQLRTVPIPLPPLDAQAQIASTVRDQLARADALSGALQHALGRAEALRRSILSRAFRGELVPQDSDEEPACVLLERIASERAASSVKTRKRRERTPA